MLDQGAARSGLLGFSAYQWLVIAAGWAGWGFDVFDALLFNFVAPNCIPALLHLEPGSPAAHEATVYWIGVITAVLLVFWAAGGVLFGALADRLGRRRALFMTIALYALGTGACAFVTSLPALILFRALASLGIGGEWGVGASLIAESVPESRRVEAGVIMQTASPLGIVLASAVNHQVAGVWFASDPANSWRFVFLAGLVPLVVALALRLGLRESEQWQAGAGRASPRELFAAPLRRATLSGAFVAVTAVLTWWASNAFIPLLGSTLAAEAAAGGHHAGAAAQHLASSWQAHASNAFNLGGLIGALAAVPLARTLSRRGLFVVYFLFSAFAIFTAYGVTVPPQARLNLLFLVGAGVYGVFGVLPFYLPELFPVRLRATGAGFCYNIGRIVAAAGTVFFGLFSELGDFRHALLYVSALVVPASLLSLGLPDPPS